MDILCEFFGQPLQIVTPDVLRGWVRTHNFKIAELRSLLVQNVKLLKAVDQEWGLRPLYRGVCFVKFDTTPHHTVIAYCWPRGCVAKLLRFHQYFIFKFLQEPADLILRQVVKFAIDQQQLTRRLMRLLISYSDELAEISPYRLKKLQKRLINSEYPRQGSIHESHFYTYRAQLLDILQS